MCLSIECENNKFARGQTISVNCGAHIIGWQRYWLRCIWYGNGFRPSILINTVTERLVIWQRYAIYIQTYMCRHSHVDRQTLLPQ
jgi:hypothetical protein